MDQGPIVPHEIIDLLTDSDSNPPSVEKKNRKYFWLVKCYAGISWD